MFLLNPSGVLFGPNARLDVQGSFHVSTADVIRLADGGVLHADLAKDSVLTVTPPAAFGFLRANPAAITIQGSALPVSPGKTLSVVGGNIEVAGGVLKAPSGRITVISVAAPREVPVPSSEQPVALQGDPAAQLGDITISNMALIDASGAGGGTVAMRVGRLQVDDSFIFADTLGSLGGAGVGVALHVTGEVESSPRRIAVALEAILPSRRISSS